MDLDPRIHLFKIVDPDLDLKWIRIWIQSGSGFEYLFFIFFIKKLQCLFLLPPKFRKGISQITKTFSFTFTLHSFGATRILINALLSDPDPDPDLRKEIEVDPDPDLDPKWGLKWIQIRIRPNVVDPGGSGSGFESETLHVRHMVDGGNLINYQIVNILWMVDIQKMLQCLRAKK